VAQGHQALTQSDTTETIMMIMTIMMGVVWFPGEYSGGRDGDQRSVVVQGSVGRDSGEARDCVDH